METTISKTGDNASASRIVDGIARYDASGPSALTIGNFDGVHLGHRALLRRTVEIARRDGTVPVALTFFPHPVRHFNPRGRFHEITPAGEKARLLAACGMGAVVVEPFSSGIGDFPPERFAREVVAGVFRARNVVVGYDFSFGKGRQGTADLLAELGKVLGFSVDVVQQVSHGGSAVSSTRIRELLLGGRVREASELLGRPYAVAGPVVEGAGRGRKIGFPTANVATETDLLPLPGVYVVDATVDGVTRRGVANIGFNPTFGDHSSLGVEVHMPGVSLDLYGREMTVLLLDRIRDERKFDGVDALVRQIAADAKFAVEAKIPTPSVDGGAS